MLKVRAIRACTRHFRYRVPPASRGRQEPPQAVEFLPWDALGPQVRGVPRGQALRYGTRAPAHSKALNAPWASCRERASCQASNSRGWVLLEMGSYRAGARSRPRSRPRSLWPAAPPAELPADVGAQRGEEGLCRSARPRKIRAGLVIPIGNALAAIGGGWLRRKTDRRPRCSAI